MYNLLITKPHVNEVLVYIQYLKFTVPFRCSKSIEFVSAVNGAVNTLGYFPYKNPPESLTELTNANVCLSMTTAIHSMQAAKQLLRSRSVGASCVRTIGDQIKDNAVFKQRSHDTHFQVHCVEIEHRLRGLRRDLGKDVRIVCLGDSMIERFKKTCELLISLIIDFSTHQP